jgi:D-alanyl-D-alanine carboxypeptidase
VIRRFGIGLLAALLLTASASQSASAATPSAKKVERAVHTLYEKYPLRSTIYGVWVKGRPLVRGALGQARPGVPATTKDHFRNGNVTEAMTVTLLLQLVEEGRVSLADPLSTWFPNIPKANEVTVGMLARSTSGYAHYAAHPDFVTELYENPQRRWKTSEVLSRAFSLPPLFDPGTSWAFSDTNFLLLGKVLRRVTGKPIESLLRDRIWSELGMRETDMRTGPGIPSPALYGYTRGRGRYEDTITWSPSSVRRAGNATSTLHDMGAWASALGTGALLSRRSHELQTGSENVGLGSLTEEFHFGMGTIVSNDWIYNNPNVFGYKGVVGYLPSKDVAVVVVVTGGPGAREAARYDQGIVNRIGELFGHSPNLVFCLDPPCSRTRDAPVSAGRARADIMCATAARDGLCFGTSGDDRIVGTDSADDILADTGDDELVAKGGDDTLHGHAGDDDFDGGEGNDFFDGGKDDDTLTGTEGDDVMVDLDPRDSDVVKAGAGEDKIAVDDGDGRDKVSCGAAADKVSADPGDDVDPRCEKT